MKKITPGTSAEQMHDASCHERMFGIDEQKKNTHPLNH